MTIEMISEKAFSEGVHLTPDTIAERTRGLPFKAQFVLRGLMKLEKGTLAMTIPGGQTFILSGRTPGPQAAVTLHNWKLVHRAIGGGAGLDGSPGTQSGATPDATGGGTTTGAAPETSPTNEGIQGTGSEAGSAEGMAMPAMLEAVVAHCWENPTATVAEAVRAADSGPGGVVAARACTLRDCLAMRHPLPTGQPSPRTRARRSAPCRWPPRST